MKQVLSLAALIVAAASVYGAAAPFGKDAAVPAKSQKAVKAEKTENNKSAAPAETEKKAEAPAAAEKKAEAPAPAAAPAPAPAPAEGEKKAEAAPGGRRGMMGGRFMEQLKEKYPNEVAEIEKLRETDPAAARTKTRELMQKAGMGFGRRDMNGGRSGALQPTPEQLEELKAKAPNEFAEYEKLKISNPDRAAVLMEGMMASVLGIYQKNLRDRHRSSVEQIKAELKKRYPEEYAAMEKTARSDKDAARKMLREMYKKSGLKVASGPGEFVYEYQDPNKNNNNRNNMQFRMGPGRSGGFGRGGFGRGFGGR